jgi:hypothetical protein
MENKRKRARDIADEDLGKNIEGDKEPAKN